MISKLWPEQFSFVPSLYFVIFKVEINRHSFIICRWIRLIHIHLSWFKYSCCNIIRLSIKKSFLNYEPPLLLDVFVVTGRLPLLSSRTPTSGRLSLANGDYRTSQSPYFNPSPCTPPHTTPTFLHLPPHCLSLVRQSP